MYQIFKLYIGRAREGLSYIEAFPGLYTIFFTSRGCHRTRLDLLRMPVGCIELHFQIEFSSVRTSNRNNYPGLCGEYKL